MEPSSEPMSLSRAQDIVATKTAPKCTEASIKARIATTEYIAHGYMTICLITMVNGFTVIGKAAAASAANHDPEVGRRFAFEDAFRSLWQLEGYLLREQLAAKDGYLPSSQA